MNRFYKQALRITLCCLIIHSTHSVPAPFQQQWNSSDTEGTIPSISERKALPLDENMVKSLEASIKSSSIVPDSDVGALNIGKKEDKSDSQDIQQAEGTVHSEHISQDNGEDHLVTENDLGSITARSSGPEEKNEEPSLSVSEVSTTDVDPSGDLNTVPNDVSHQSNEDNSAVLENQEIVDKEIAQRTRSVPNSPDETTNIDLNSENFQHTIQETDNDKLAEISRYSKAAALPHDETVPLNQIPGSSVTQESMDAENQSLLNADSRFDTSHIRGSEELNIEPVSENRDGKPSSAKHESDFAMNTLEDNNSMHNTDTEVHKFSSNGNNEVQDSTKQETLNDHSQVYGGNTDKESSEVGEAITEEGESKNEGHQSTNEQLLDDRSQIYGGNAQIDDTKIGETEKVEEDIQSAGALQQDRDYDGKDMNEILDANSVQNNIAEVSGHHTDTRQGMEHEEEHTQIEDVVGIQSDSTTHAIEDESIQQLENENVIDAANERSSQLALGDRDTESSENLGVFEKYATERELNERSLALENAGVHTVEKEIEKDPQVVLQEEAQRRQALARDPDQKWNNQPQHMYTGYTYRPLHFNQEQKSDSAAASSQTVHQAQETVANTANTLVHTEKQHTVSHDTLHLGHSADDGSVGAIRTESDKNNAIDEELNPVPLGDHSDTHNLGKTHTGNGGGELYAKQHAKVRIKPHDRGSTMKDIFDGLIILLFLVLGAKMGYKWFVSSRDRRMYIRKLRNPHKLDVDV